ncbi:DUF397 domain-containing protein [Streptomyces sp. NPDC091281]|uniref:DUF397 domain-containing protein n=1 Tax=Streptomyces sp. NPDC091281 TaxID=3365985 RepID=UPI0038148143
MNPHPRPALTEWVTSSYSGPEGGNCLEWAPAVAVTSGVVPVRDSKAPAVGTVRVDARAWTAFVSHARQQAD